MSHNAAEFLWTRVFVVLIFKQTIKKANFEAIVVLSKATQNLRLS